MLTKLLSAIMSIVVFLSGAFPALFGGKEYIDPNGSQVTIVDANAAYDTAIINDYEAFIALGNIGVAYDEEFFNNNSLAILTVEYQDGDEFLIKSVCKNGTKIEIDYIIIDKNLTYIYAPIYKTIIVETSKDIKIVAGDNKTSLPNLFKLY